MWWKDAQFTAWRENKLMLRYLIPICCRQEIEGNHGTATGYLKPKKEAYLLSKLLQFNILVSGGPGPTGARLVMVPILKNL